MQIIVFILGLSLLITIHELGHFIVAKIFGVYCHEFSIGMGPAIFSKKKGETKYSIRCLPIGGYVSMAGEEVNSNIKEDDSNIVDAEIVEKDTEEKENKDEEEMIDIPYERTINGIKAWKRFLVIGAGVFMNFVLAYILFFIYIVDVGLADTNSYLEVNYSSTESEVYAFEEAGIPEGKFKVDRVENKIVYVYEGNEVEIYLNDTETTTFDEASVALGIPASIGEDVYAFSSDIVATNEDNITKITFESKNYQIKQYLKVYSEGNVYTPSRLISKLEFNLNNEDNTYTILSSSMNKWGYSQSSRDATIGECFKYAGQMEIQNGLAIFDALGKLFTKEGINNVGGVIAMADASNTYLSYGFGYYMAFLGLISVNLGVMNLLPIPGLDGSQLLVIIIEGITRKKLPDKAKAIVNFIGLVFLMGLMILITIKDVFKFII